MKNEYFIFTNEIPSGKDKFIARISPFIASDKELFDALHYQCWFPAWGGKNWDALSDLLITFEDIEEQGIYIVHKELPHIGEIGLKIYIRILYRACLENLPRKNLYIIFPVDERENVLNILKEALSDKDNFDVNMENIDASSS